ncbi:photosystem II reaction center PSB28 protein, chloroplastic [Gastrolobium bilobum]|uniref:photosystem II reaction center PSB28 protein, chloroplastic n=1 Tax=Gastrolobium bilobum TaxID=150636 RepID=UPI002AAF80BE|nr:photosystem II reaction center PSB28 protein, chloroplastic [Gastrolobium bilobum]
MTIRERSVQHCFPLLSFLLAMATLHSLALSFPLSNLLQKPRSYSVPSSIVHRSTHSSFNGQRLQTSCLRLPMLTQNTPMSMPVIMMAKPTIQFIQGTDEQTIPDVRLTKSRDGTNGMAIFRFDQPSVFDSSGEVGDITGFYMIDEEGILQSVDVSAKFVNGKPSGIEAKYVMRTPREWDRFMRFMERYSNANGLQFIKK